MDGTRTRELSGAPGMRARDVHRTRAVFQSVIGLKAADWIASAPPRFEVAAMIARQLAPVLAVFVSSAVFSSAVRAEEGMWTFDNFPSARVKAAYGFAPDQAWLDHVRLASV